MSFEDWKPSIRVNELRARAEVVRQQLVAEGEVLQPVQSSGRKIASTFWGFSWCQNLNRYADYEHRLPRGRTYLRHGCVLDLRVEKGCIRGLVQAAEMHTVTIRFEPLTEEHWQTFIESCHDSIGSTIDLLKGRLPESVLKALIDPHHGLFPEPESIKASCDCLDWADLCDHAAAVLYGLGVRLDEAPGLFFTLRDIDQNRLLSDVNDRLSELAGQVPSDQELGDLEALFQIELEPGE